MRTIFILLGIYEKARLSLDEVCDAIGYNKKTAYTHRSLGKFPIPMVGTPLTADIRDVAEYIDQVREEANEELERMGVKRRV